MTLIDTHTHLYLTEFDDDRNQAVARALENGIAKMIMPNIDSGSFEPMMNTAERFAGICIPMIGLHPTSVSMKYEDELAFLFNAARTIPFAAIGETGIDMYWDTTFLEQQKISFRKHIEIALELNLPLVIHARDSFPVIFEILSDYSGSGLRGVFHAFTGTAGDLEKATGIGFMVGIGGIVTFKNSGLANVIARTNIENILLETDSPYLAPVPYRGKRNESSYLTEINRRVAAIYGITPEESAAITTENAGRLFNTNC
ncbi:MAG: TatD family hydrolase [Bacteroidales bacterium]